MAVGFCNYSFEKPAATILRVINFAKKHGYFTINCYFCKILFKTKRC